MTTIARTEDDISRGNELDFARELYGQRVWQYDVVSGAQIKVVLGDNVILEDCTAIQFTLTQSKKPIYGYHSEYFDAVARGIVIVHGRLWINFIHQGYLRTLLALAHSGGNLDSVKRVERDQLIDPDDRYRTGDLTNEEDVVKFVQKENLQRLRQFTSYSMKDRPDDSTKPLTIQIHYGDRSKSYGVPLKVIYDVHFMGEGQDIQISGQPQQEWYEFLARKVT